MANMIVQLGDVNINETVGRLLGFVGEKKSVANKLSSIYIAPCTLRDLSPSSFQPQVVSIGPLHRKDETLQLFEVPKAALVHDLLYRASDPSPIQTLTACVEKVASMIGKIRGCYGDIKSWDDIELTIMMVMDACFILEFVHSMSNYPPLRFRDQQIPYDLLLLENQIPFFVLQNIHSCLASYYKHQPLNEFIHPLVEFTNIFQGRIKVGGSHIDTNHDHILGYLLHCYQPKYDLKSGFPRSTIRSAVELVQAGVKFTPNHDAEWPMAMEVKMSSYCPNVSCTLKMPTLRIDDFTEMVLRNLNAYEVSYTPMCYPYFTSYVWAMDMLVHTHDDIAKLVKSKVMVNHIGSNEEAANMLKRLCKELVPEHFYYTQEWKQLDSHCKRYLPIKIAKLKRACFQLKVTYFSSPWSTIALFAGIIIFVLTWVQTIFTVKSSFTQKD